MKILQTAAAQVASVSNELAALGDVALEFNQCMETNVVAARAALDELVLNRQQDEVLKAMLPPQDFATKKDRCVPFDVQLPGSDIAPHTTQIDRQQCIKALGVVPTAPQLQCSFSALYKWCLTVVKSKLWTTQHLVLEKVKQLFFVNAEQYLKVSPSSASSDNTCLSAQDLHRALELLTIYSKVVAEVESRDGVWKSGQPADACIPMLLTVLRSRESLLTCILKCLVHHRVASEEWKLLQKYKLPLEADDLRRLVLGGNHAENSALIVAGYICRVADNSCGQVCFSLSSDHTLKCIADYAGILPSITSIPHFTLYACQLNNQHTGIFISLFEFCTIHDAVLRVRNVQEATPHSCSCWEMRKTWL